MLSAEGSVEVPAEAGVLRVAGDLADVVELFDERLEVHPGELRRGLAAMPPRQSIHASSAMRDHCVPRGQGPNLVVAELALMRDEGPAVVVAGPEWTAESLERFPEAVVAEMRDIENDPEAADLLEQRRGRSADPAGGIGA